MSLQDTAPEPKANRGGYRSLQDVEYRNPYPGLTPREVKLKRLINSTTVPAIKRLMGLIHSDNETVAVAACRELLNRALGMPNQRTQVNVEVSADAHVRALLELARRSRDTAEMRVIEASATDAEDTPSSKPTD